MLRPSRPMIRPFMSSAGIWHDGYRRSPAASPTAMRWIVAVMISRARGPAVSLRLFLDLAHEAVRIVADLVLEVFEQQVLGLAGAEV